MLDTTSTQYNQNYKIALFTVFFSTTIGVSCRQSWRPKPTAVTIAPNGILQPLTAHQPLLSPFPTQNYRA